MEDDGDDGCHDIIAYLDTVRGNKDSGDDDDADLDGTGDQNKDSLSGDADAGKYIIF